MKTIILDTNFLVYCAKFRIDFFSEIDRICTFPYSLCVLDKTVQELNKLKPKELKLIRKFLEKIKLLKSNYSYVDEDLKKYSSEGCIVATQDRALKKRLVSAVIVIRQKKYLEII